jgi:hypothetical protein
VFRFFIVRVYVICAVFNLWASTYTFPVNELVGWTNVAIAACFFLMVAVTFIVDPLRPEHFLPKHRCN